MAAPGFWADREKAREASAKLSALKKAVGRSQRITSDLATVRELLAVAGDDESARQEIGHRVRELERETQALEIEQRFTGAYDRGNAVLSIFAGAGGKDAEDWPAMLRRMYERWAARQDFAVRTIHEHFGELDGPSGWGLKNVALETRGPNAYGCLKRENGVHRLVRISPFSAKSLRHTSFALVEVMPEFVAAEEIVIKPEEIRTDFFRSSGPGGQNVNKRETAVRVTHLPTGTQVAVQIERSQERNREIAMRLLAAKLYQHRLRAQEREAARLRTAARGGSPSGRGESVAIEWGSQIRSYVLHPYQLVKDHRSGYETSNVVAVLDGELDEFIEDELRLTPND